MVEKVLFAAHDVQITYRYSSKQKKTVQYDKHTSKETPAISNIQNGSKNPYCS